MFQRDYILRMIEQMTSIVGRYVLLLQEQKKPKEVLIQLEEFYGKLMLPPSKLLVRMKDEELLDLVSVNGTPDLDKTVALAFLLKQEGTLYEDLGEPENSLPRLLKAQFLYLTAYRQEAQVADVNLTAQIDETRELLRVYEVPPKHLAELLTHYEDRGLYATAEDVLFELLEAAPTGENHERGMEFFNRLDRLSDEALEAGDLPRSELEEGRLAMERVMQNDNS